MTTHSSGAGTPGPMPALPAAPAAAPATPATPAGAPAPAAPAAPATPPAPPPALTADEVRAWLALRGVAAADMNDPDIRIDIVSLEGAMSDRQLSNTLGWIRDKLVAAGKPGFDAAGVTIVSLLAEVAAAAAAMAPAAPAGPKPPSRAWRALLWLLGAFSWALTKIRSAGRTVGRGIATGARAVGRTAVSGGGAIGRGFASGAGAISRRWKPLLIVAAGLALLAGLVFGGMKGFEWWQMRAHEAAQTPSPAPPPPVVVAPTPAPVIPGPTGPAIYHSLLDMECLMYGRLQACNLPPGCTEGFITNPPRLQVSCPGGVTYMDGRSMTEYPANQRVSVTLHRQ